MHVTTVAVRPLQRCLAFTKGVRDGGSFAVHAGHRPPPVQYYWMDALCMTMHLQETEAAVKQVKRMFLTVLAGCDRLLLVDSRLADSLDHDFRSCTVESLSRFWCLWELYACLSLGSTLQLCHSVHCHGHAGSIAQHDVNWQLRQRSAFSSIRSAVQSIRIEEAAAYRPFAPGIMLEELRRAPGLSVVNATIASGLEASLCSAWERRHATTRPFSSHGLRSTLPVDASKEKFLLPCVG